MSSSLPRRCKTAPIDLPAFIATVGTVFGDDSPLLDHQTAPGDDAPVVEKIVANDRELGFVVALDVWVVNFPRLDKRMKVSCRYSSRTVTAAGRLARQKKSK